MALGKAHLKGEPLDLPEATAGHQAERTRLAAERRVRHSGHYRHLPAEATPQQQDSLDPTHKREKLLLSFRFQELDFSKGKICLAHPAASLLEHMK